MKKIKILLIEHQPDMIFRPIRFLKNQKDIELQIVISQAGIDNFKQKWEKVENLKNGLEHYDLIIMEPYFPFHPRYSYEETAGSTQTGWFLYRDLMADLPNTKVAIWTHPVQQYSYGPNNYPERKWGDHVTIVKKDGTDDYSLVNLIQKLCH